LTDCIFKRKKQLVFFLHVVSIIQHNASLPITEVSEQDRAVFTHKQKPWYAAEFGRFCCGEP